MQTERETSDSLAIVGIGCRFPGASDTPEDFWRMLCDGVDATGIIPEDRWSAAKYFDANPAKAGKMITERGGFLDEVDLFDPQFFGVSPREAHTLDPQQRLLLRATWEALEDSGIPPDALAGTPVGVFIGGFTSDYQLLQNHGKSSRYRFKPHSATGMMMTMLANRISYTFDFLGPSMTVDTACSSSLVAVHLAAQSIWNGECEVALAGGVNVIIGPNTFVAESKSGFLSPDGRSKSFDQSANGYARGEGGGVVVIKRLDKALRDGDQIYARILGTGVTQDGHTDGITVPNEESQEAAITYALRRAGLEPSDIGYVEAHGTGTPVGDPIEASALAKALAGDRPRKRPLLVGSVKTNIGHLEAGAGVAGLIKAALAVKHGFIPPNLHFETPNSLIDLDRLNIEIAGTGRAWPDDAGERMAGVNSFGFGGTNAHVILAEPPAQPVAAPSTGLAGDLPLAVLPISARAEDALGDTAAQLAEYLRTSTDVTLTDLGYTLSQRRAHLSYRRTLTVDGLADAQRQLETLAAAGDADKHTAVGKTQSGTPKLAFVCTGMGAQWWKMCRGLLGVYPAFTASIERSDRALRTLMGWSLIEELRAEECDSRMTETHVAQPANFAIQIALAEQLREFGVVPDAVIGHSAGEVTAHYLAGVLTFEQAIQVIYHRSQLLQRASGLGGMLAIGLSAEALMQTIDTKTRSDMGPRVSVAAINSTSAVVVSGDREVLDDIARQLNEVELFNRFLTVDVPYHSHYMDPLRDDLAVALADISPNPATIPIYSTVTGELLDPRAADGSYWWHNTRATVLFEPALGRMLDDGYTHFVEIGPHPVMASAITEVAGSRHTDVVVLASQRRHADDSRMLMDLVGALHCHGHPVAWDAFYPKESARLLPLPRYPWQVKRFWNETPETAEDLHYRPVHPLLGQPIVGAHPTWEAEFSVATIPFLADHKVQGSTLVPGAAFIEMALAAGREGYGSSDFCVENLTLRHALVLDETCDPIVRTTLNADTGTVEFAVCSANANGDLQWRIAATAELNTAAEHGGTVTGADANREATATIDADEFYERGTAMGFEYGDTFRAVTSVASGEDWATARLRMPESVANELADYRFHPALVDAALQSLLAVAFSGADLAQDVYLPAKIRRSTVHRNPEQDMVVHVSIVSASKEEIESDIVITTVAGEPLVSLEGFLVQSLGTSASLSPERVDKGLYDVKWIPADGPDESKSIAAKDLSWLVLEDSSGIGTAVATRLRDQGQRVRTVTPASVDDLVEVDKGYQVDPGRPEHFAAAIAAHLAKEGDLAGIVDCWPIDVPADPTPEATDAGRRIGLFTVLHIAKAIAGLDTAAPRLYLVTANAQPAPGTQQIAVDQAPIWGLGRVIGHQELTDKWGGLIDIDGVDDPATSAEQICGVVLTEDAEDQVAFRGSEIYVPRVCPADTMTRAFPPKLASDATYLVTGGFGALGRVVAKYLADRGARHIALLSRTSLPPRDEWSQMPADDPRCRAVATIRKIEELGVQVTVGSVDIADAEQVRTWASRYAESGGRPVRGIIHAAGTVDDQLLVNTDEVSFTKVLTPKIAGARALRDAFAGQRLDFFVLFGSAGSVIASPGQGNYAAANAFMDAFAHVLRAEGMPALTIGWGPWSVGMVEELNLEKIYTRRGIDLITPAAGCQILDRVINQRVATVIAISADWGRARAMGLTAQMPPMFEELGKAEAFGEDADAGFSIVDLLRHTPEAEHLGVVASYVTQIIASVFDLPPEDIGGDDALNDLGLDSMMAIELKTRIAAVLTIDLPVLDLLKGVSVNSLAVRILAVLNVGDDSAVPVVDERSDAATPEDDIDRLIEQLSESELKELLADLGGGQSTTDIADTNVGRAVETSKVEVS